MATIRVADGSVVNVLMNRLRGLKVRLRREVRTGAMVLPEGTVATIYSTWRSGVNIDSDPCGKCGVQVHVRKLHRDDIELLEAPR